MAKTIVYKFGGASVKDSSAVKNILEILRNRLRKSHVIVVSAMGKMTNLLENIILQKLQGEEYSSNSAIFKQFHVNICEEIFDDGHPIFSQIENEYQRLITVLESSVSAEQYDSFYDKVVCFGEILSTRIVMEYLCQEGMTTVWYDARQLIQTNSDHRFAKVDWNATEQNCKKKRQRKRTVANGKNIQKKRFQKKQ